MKKLQGLIKKAKNLDYDLSNPQYNKEVFWNLLPIFMLWLVKIWQVSSCGKFMQEGGNGVNCLMLKGLFFDIVSVQITKYLLRSV